MSRGIVRPERASCAWCGRALTSAPTGRPRTYCRRSCRQRAYESRRRGSELGLGDDELIVTRNELDDARDRLYLSGLAVDDARDDLADQAPPGTVLERLLDSLDAIVGENPTNPTS